MGWAARTHTLTGSTKPLVSKIARVWQLRPGQRLSMSRGREYVVRANGSLRRLRHVVEKAA